MTYQTPLNTPVAITAVGFGRNMRSYPRRMEYDGQTYRFLDAGIRTVIRTGERVAQILSMSDGTHNFQLRTDNHGGSWTLISMQ